MTDRLKVILVVSKFLADNLKPTQTNTVKHNWQPKITPIKQEDPMWEYQINMEKLFDKNQTIKKLTTALKESVTITEDLKKLSEQDAKIAIKALAHLMLLYKTTPAVLIGILSASNKNCDLQDISNLLVALVNMGLILYVPETAMLQTRFAIPSDMQKEMDAYQYPLPMLVKPEKVQNNKDNGYLTRKDSILLGTAYHEKDVCLNVVNLVNNIEYTINNKVAAKVKNSWRNLDKLKEGETYQELHKRKKAFEKFSKVVGDILFHLNIANNKFYLTNKYDKRGRVYHQGYHINPQGNQWSKAIIEFSNKEQISSM